MGGGGDEREGRGGGEERTLAARGGPERTAVGACGSRSSPRLAPGAEFHDEVPAPRGNDGACVSLAHAKCGFVDNQCHGKFNGLIDRDSKGLVKSQWQ